jgi:hypothetical protein
MQRQRKDTYRQTEAERIHYDGAFLTGNGILILAEGNESVKKIEICTKK